MKKAVAVFDIDEAKLEEVEDGSLQNAFGWLEDSGVYLFDYKELSNDADLEENLKSPEEIRVQAIDEFAEEVKQMLNGITIAQMTVDEISSKLKSKHTKTQTLVSPTL